MKLNEHGYPIPRKQYTIKQDDGETIYYYEIFSTEDVKKQFPDLFDKASKTILMKDLDNYDLDAIHEMIATLSPLREFSNGPGRWFGQ